MGRPKNMRSCKQFIVFLIFWIVIMLLFADTGTLMEGMVMLMAPSVSQVLWFTTTKTVSITNYRHAANGISIINHTAHDERLKIDRNKGIKDKDNKREPKEISYLRFNTNFDLVDWGMCFLNFGVIAVQYTHILIEIHVVCISEWYDNVKCIETSYWMNNLILCWESTTGPEQVLSIRSAWCRWQKPLYAVDWGAGSQVSWYWCPVHDERVMKWMNWLFCQFLGQYQQR